jgi:membrane protein CcdC involved in cytochrome C biogenesis
MTPQQTHILVTILFVALIAWRMHARVRRLIGRQKLAPARPWINVVLFPVLVALLALGSRLHPLAAGALVAGAALGIALGVIGLRRTRFEVTAEGLYYTPSAHLGIALSVLLVARILWRFLSVGFPVPGSAPPPPPGSTLTPLTLALLGTLAGYYFTYAVGLLRWAAKSRSLSPKPQTPS